MKSHQASDGFYNVITKNLIDTRCGLVVSVLATGPTGYSVAGSSPTEDSGFLWVIKIRSTHFLRREVKLSVPCKRTLHSMSELLCRPNFLTCFSPVIFSCFATSWLWLLNQADSKTSVVAAG
jgi:hypothetical protein